MNALKFFAYGTLLGFVLGLMTCKNCTPARKPCGSDTATIRKHDTTVILLPPQAREFPQPTMAREVAPRIDSFIAFETVVDSALVKKYNHLTEKYNGLLLDYHTARSYSDSATFPSGTVVGDAQVSGNKLQHLTLSLLNPTQTVITTTETKVVQQWRTIGFLGLQGGFQLPDSAVYIGGTFRLKLKNDMLLGVSAKYSSRNNLLFEGEYAVPIRLGKRK